MTFQDMYTEVKSYLSNKADFTDPSAKALVNRMYRNVSTSFRFRNRQKLDTSQSTVDGTATLNIPTNARDVLALKLTGTVEYVLEKQTREWYDQQDTTAVNKGRPEYFIPWNTKIYLWPTPNAVYTTQITYLDLPADMVNNGDVPELPVEWHEFVVLLAASRACFLNSMDLRGMNLKSEALGLLTTLTEDNTRDQRGVVGQISVQRTRSGSMRPTGYAEDL